MTVSRGVSFDPAVPFYDETRALSPAADAAVQALLRRELAGRGPCLEVGVGTGRVALPLAIAGVPMIGVDLSRLMMERIAVKAGGAAPFPLVQGDATRLPFRAGSFAAAIACHVLHLIPPWQEAADELLRVLRRGGLLLIEDTGRGRPLRASADDADRQLRREVGRHFRELLGLDQPRRGGLRAMADLDAFMQARGVAVRLLEPIVETRETTIERMIARLERGQSSRLWDVPAARRQAAAAETRRWAHTQIGAIDRPLTVRRAITWHAYTLPAA